MRWRAPELGWLLVGASLAGACAPASAQTASTKTSGTELEAPAADDIGVSMEFLEFLGEWEAGDGEWIDPAQVQSASAFSDSVRFPRASNGAFSRHASVSRTCRPHSAGNCAKSFAACRPRIASASSASCGAGSRS